VSFGRLEAEAHVEIESGAPDNPHACSRDTALGALVQLKVLRSEVSNGR